MGPKTTLRIIIDLVFDRLRPLIHFPTTKTGSLNVALLWCKQSGAAMINGKAATMELT
jgi:hypothetical protein